MPLASASIVIPTYNERENLPRCIEALRRALEGRFDYELVVVDDDSPDRTWELAETMAASDPRIRIFRRIDRKGLSSAIVDGLSMGRGERLAVVDADCQHDLTKVPDLLALLEDHDMAVGTRYAGGGGTGEWSRRRVAMSRLATLACRVLLRIRVSDPMSGFFALRHDVFRDLAPKLNPRGYKLLMEMLYHHGPERIGEVPYTFVPRTAGESKLGGMVVADFAWSLLELGSHRLVNARFAKYCLVGASGVAVQLGMLTLLQRAFSEPVALALAIGCAVISNYLINNAWTFRDRSHRSWGERLSGIAKFVLVALGGAVINHAISYQLHQQSDLDLRLTSLVGIAFATLWNFQFNYAFTWSGWRRPE